MARLTLSFCLSLPREGALICGAELSFSLNSWVLWVILLRCPQASCGQDSSLIQGQRSISFLILISHVSPYKLMVMCIILQGSVGSTSFYSTCQSNGKWSNSKLKCQRMYFFFFKWDSFSAPFGEN